MIAYQRALARALADPARPVPGVDERGVRRFVAIARRKNARTRRTPWWSRIASRFVRPNGRRSHGVIPS